MTVRRSDGAKAGRVTDCGPDAFRVAKGLLFRREFDARYEQVDAVRRDQVWLHQGGDPSDPRPLPDQVGLGATEEFLVPPDDPWDPQGKVPGDERSRR